MLIQINTRHQQQQEQQQQKAAMERQQSSADCLNEAIHSPKMGRSLPGIRHEDISSQHGGGGGKCSCGLPNPKFCMLNLIDAMSKVKKRQHIWVPMNICSAYS